VISLWPGLEISFDELDGEAYLVDLGEQGGEIVVNSKRPMSRKRFSIGHELGHWYLRECGFPIVADGVADTQSVERWCDQFAAEMLMPWTWVTRDLDGVSLLPAVDTILRMPQRYRVSKSAMYIRLSELTNFSLFEIVERRSTMHIAARYVAHRSERGLFSGLTEVVTSLSRLTSHKLIESNGYVFAIKIVRDNEMGRRWLVIATGQDSEPDLRRVGDFGVG
jgi:Zn-dependent peptidase ImmA (M78 family)